MSWRRLARGVAFLLALAGEAAAEAGPRPGAPWVRGGILADPMANRLGHWSNPRANRAPGYPQTTLNPPRLAAAPRRAVLGQDRIAASPTSAGDEEVAGWHLDLRAPTGVQRPCPDGTRPRPLEQPHVGFRCVPR